MANKNTKELVYNFFENPKSAFGKFVRFFIIILILYSGVEFIIEYTKNDFYEQYK